MKKRILRAISIILMILNIAFISGCDLSKEDGVWSEVINYTIIDDGSSDSGTTVVNDGLINIVKDGKSSFKLVSSLSNEGYDQARLIQKVIKYTTGASIPLISDYEERKTAEIIIGDTAREESSAVAGKIKGTKYIIKSFENGNIVINASCSVALQKAVYVFLNKYFGYDENNTTEGKYVPVPANKEEISDVLDEYSNMVWGDDFNGSSLDTSKWLIKAEMESNASLELRDGPEAISVSGGSLQMTSGRISDNKYYTNQSVTTGTTMAFKYGYVEMKAKVPFGKPCWPSWWMLTSNLTERQTYSYVSEVDMFEVFATDDTLEANLHKWYRDAQGGHYSIPKSKKTNMIFKSKSVAEEWHTYGFLWTDKSMNILVDGEVFQYFDITDKGDFGERGDGMSGFHDPMYLIFNNYLYTKDYGGSETWAAGKEATATDPFPRTYYIDYIKIYQKTGEGLLVKGG